MKNIVCLLCASMVFLISCKGDKTPNLANQVATESMEESTDQISNSENSETKLEEKVAEVKKETFKPIEKKKAVVVKTSVCDDLLNELKETVEKIAKDPNNDGLWDKVDQLEENPAYENCRKGSKEFMNKYDTIYKQLDNY